MDGLDDSPSLANKRDAIMIRLLDTCIGALARQGVRKLFVDAVKGGDEGFRSMGKRRAANGDDGFGGLC